MTAGYILEVIGTKDQKIVDRLEKNRALRNGGGYEIGFDIDGSTLHSYADFIVYYPRIGTVVWFHGPGHDDPRVWRNAINKVRKKLGCDITLIVIGRTTRHDLYNEGITGLDAVVLEEVQRAQQIYSIN